MPLTRDEQLAELSEARLLSPCVDQTREQIEAYYRVSPIGSPAAVRHTQYGQLRYIIRTIEGRNLRSGNVHIENDGAFSMKTGRNRFHPKGQTTLVEPTAAVLAWITINPKGAFGVSIYREEAFPFR